MLDSFRRSNLLIEDLSLAQTKLEALGDKRMGVQEFMAHGKLVDGFRWRHGPHDDFHTYRNLAITGLGGRLILQDYPEIDLNLQALEVTAAIHDSHRLVDDAPDWMHGWRAAKWAKNNLAGNLSASVLREVMFLCTYHNFPDGFKLLPKALLRQQSWLLALAAFKDFDGADRFRNGNDLNPGFLRLGVSLTILPLAKKLHDLTEIRRDEGTPAGIIVASESLKLGLMIE